VARGTSQLGLSLKLHVHLEMYFFHETKTRKDDQAFLAIFFRLPSQKFLPISFKIQLLETSPQKQKGHRQKQLDVSISDVFSLPVHFEFFAVFS
jgi:hypothetical protein